MPTVQLNITGGTYRHKSLDVSAQTCRNFWPQKQTDERAKSTYILESFHGKELWGAEGTGADRGMFYHNGVLYKVTGTNLYSIDSAGTFTTLGTIAGTDRCIFAPLGDNIVIERNQIRYHWDSDTSTLSTITDADLEAGDGIASINNQMVYGGTGGRFAVSDVGDATSIDGLNYATAEADADDLVRPYTFNQVLYLYGQKTTELWWNSGQGNPPFDRFEGGVLNVGLGAFHSLSNNDDSMFFLGDDYEAYTMRGGSSSVITPIAPQPLVREFKTYTDYENAIGYCYKLDNQSFWQITFPTSDKTWVYQVGGEWFELASGHNGDRDISNSYAFAFGKHLVADYRNGNIYELKDDVYTENGETIIRTRISSPIHGGLVNAAGKQIEMTRFELILQCGVGLASGQGSDPEVMFSYSDDGGHTYSTERRMHTGEMGEYLTKVETFNLGRFENRIIKISVSDPIYWSIHSAAVDLEVCI